MALFGTDGVRGLANRDLTAELALELAVSAAHILGEAGAFAGHRPKAIVGYDSRRSGEFLEAAVVAGLASAGVDVIRVGIIPTPAVAYLVKESGADLGVMISASHNPMPDNGIKFFDREGGKLPDQVEAAIEARLNEDWVRPVGADVGMVIVDNEAENRYADFLLSTIDHNLAGLKVVVDCANGAASFVAPNVYQKAGAEVIAIHASPNGVNINENCGSTHLADIKAKVLASACDLGIAHDGDADRCLLISKDGDVIDGDFILAILAKHFNLEVIVSTVMANLGFQKAMDALGIKVITTAVGDRYVLEAMVANGYRIGGEQSGHVIFRDYAGTGDGILTALQIMNAMVAAGASLTELAQVMKRYPQVLENVKVASKYNFESNTAIKSAIATAQEKLAGNGRVLVRASGTENLIRVMVEAAEEMQAQALAQEISAVVRAELS
jgi:phosphoglucosamine mutase